MKTEDMEGKRISELLGIDKPEEWMAEQWDICSKRLEGDSELFSNVATQFLIKSGQLEFVLKAKLGDMEEGLVRLTRLFLTIGYMLGKTDQEKLGGLDKLWGKEEK